MQKGTEVGTLPDRQGNVILAESRHSRECGTPTQVIPRYAVPTERGCNPLTCSMYATQQRESHRPCQPAPLPATHYQHPVTNGASSPRIMQWWAPVGHLLRMQAAWMIGGQSHTCRYVGRDLQGVSCQEESQVLPCQAHWISAPVTNLGSAIGLRVALAQHWTRPYACALLCLILLYSPYETPSECESVHFERRATAFGSRRMHHRARAESRTHATLIQLARPRSRDNHAPPARLAYACH